MIKSPVSKIHSPVTRNETAKLADIIIKSIQEKKGDNILCLDLRKIEVAVSDYFVICHGNSSTQVTAIANFVEENVFNKSNFKPWHKEGFENRQWIVLDYIDVVVHIFQHETREFYNIEGLWADARIQIISDNESDKLIKVK